MNEPNGFEEWNRGVERPPSRGSGSDPGGETEPGVADLWGEASEPVPYRTSRRPDWLAPALVIVLASLAFATAWFITRGSGSRPPVAQPSAATAPSDTPSSRTQPQTGTAAPSTSEAPASSSTTPSSSVATKASFPAGTVATCGSGEAVPTSSVRLARGTNSTCSYVADVVTKVNAHLAENPGATTYTVSPDSSSLRKVVTLHCTRADHLSECTGGSNVRLWVSDSVG